MVSQRHQYLRELRRARDRGDHIVYLDETWVNVNHAYTGEWSENEESAVSMIVGVGLVIVVGRYRQVRARGLLSLMQVVGM